ncbi:hypothetical protein D3C86_1502780 [compost metagenome]
MGEMTTHTGGTGKLQQGGQEEAQLDHVNALQTDPVLHDCSCCDGFILVDGAADRLPCFGLGVLAGLDLRIEH